MATITTICMHCKGWLGSVEDSNSKKNETSHGLCEACYVKHELPKLEELIQQNKSKGK